MTAVTEARARARGGRARRDAEKSALAQTMVTDLLALEPVVRRGLVRQLTERDMAVLLAATAKYSGSVYGLWIDDPVGFVEDVLGENIWSKQHAVLAALGTTKRVAVPAGFGLGKTFLGARAAAWFCCTRPVASATVITTATRMRQVARQMWPHIRRLHARAGLPGKCDTTQWKMQDRNGVETVVAYGFTAPEHDEAAMQGVHDASVLLIVDEAGGISRAVGAGTNNLLTGVNDRMLAIGNPATDDDRSWFEQLCGDGEDPQRTDTVTIRIPTTSSPAITGEATDPCRDHPDMPPHSLATHLPRQTWIDDAIRDHGPDSRYVIAKVHAKFPKGSARSIVPVSWIEAAVDQVEPEGPGWLALDELDLPEETESWLVEPGAWVRLGVDVAADGGDEFVIARSVGDLFTVEHVSAGDINANAVDVAGQVLLQIRRAEALRVRLGTVARVRVKVDSIGVGWGVASTLEAWGREQLHNAEIVSVNVAEDTKRVADGSTMVPYRKRDEMWIAGRTLVQPVKGDKLIPRLRIDSRTVAQLAGPRYETTSDGRTRVESKKSLRERRIPSPDRAEAMLLSVYEPRVPRRARLLTRGVGGGPVGGVWRD